MEATVFTTRLFADINDEHQKKLPQEDGNIPGLY